MCKKESMLYLTWQKICLGLNEYNFEMVSYSKGKSLGTRGRTSGTDFWGLLSKLHINWRKKTLGVPRETLRKNFYSTWPMWAFFGWKTLKKRQIFDVYTVQQPNTDFGLNIANLSSGPLYAKLRETLRNKSETSHHIGPDKAFSLDKLQFSLPTHPKLWAKARQSSPSILWRHPADLFRHLKWTHDSRTGATWDRK